MKSAKSKKLQLHRESLRLLTPQEMEHAAGGAGSKGLFCGGTIICAPLPIGPIQTTNSIVGTVCNSPGGSTLPPLPPLPSIKP